MLTHGFTCNIFNLLKFSPLVKNKRKGLDDSNNYRAIAINSCFIKILDYCILDAFEDVFISNSCEQQFAYKPNNSTTNCTFILSEVVNYYVKHGSKVFVILIDCSKAFDSVEYDKLFSIVI